MERADKIFTILAGLGLVAVLVHQHRHVGRGERVNISASPAVVIDSGPAYLVSNLPTRRDRDDSLPFSSYPENWSF